MTMPTPDFQPAMPAAPVTLLDIYTRQVEMGAQLAVIGEQLKAIPDHEQRLRLLESAKAKLYGAAGVIGVVAGTLGTWVTLAVTHHT